MPLRNLAAALAAVGLACGLAVAILTGTAADNAAAADPAEALTWRSKHPAALRRLATEHIQAGSEADIRRAERLSRQALRTSPLGSEALSLLGLAADARGDQAKAGVLMNFAAARSLRDRPSHVWLFERDLAAGRAGGAWFHADMLLRSGGSLVEELSPFLLQLVSQPGASEPLAARLALKPRWRAGVLSELCSKGPDSAALQEVFQAMQRTSAPATADELGCWLRRLTEDRRYAEAQAAWLAFLPAEQRPIAGPPYNGGFERPAGASPFDWETARDAGGEVILAPSGDTGRGYALRVIPAGERRGAWIRQLLVLRPGSYVLTLASRGERPGAGAAMRWTVRCAESQALLGAAGLSETGPDWSQAAAAFDVPGLGCEAQHLALEGASPSLSALESSAPTWFDDLRVRPRSPPSAPAA